MKLVVLVFCKLALFAAAAPFIQLPSPALPGAGQPNLAVSSEGMVYLSWVEGGEVSRLKMARYQSNGWSKPTTIAQGGDWFVNWADFPSLILLGQGKMAAHWLVKHGHGYHIYMARSEDWAAAWGAPFRPHQDRTATEHGFVSMFEAESKLGVVWLDGREMQPGPGDHGHGNMTLRFAIFDEKKQPLEEAVLDSRVCDCCQTAAVMTERGPLVAYRDRSNQEVRDIAIVRHRQGQWTTPRLVHPDGWQIPGCPVNGPALVARGARVAVAWFTAAGGKPRVLLALSKDAGETFSPPVTVDDQNPAGRVDLAQENERIVISWLDGQGRIQAGWFDREGPLSDGLIAGRASTDRATGFPQIVLVQNEVWAAWTDGGVKISKGQLQVR